VKRKKYDLIVRYLSLRRFSPPNRQPQSPLRLRRLRRDHCERRPLLQWIGDAAADFFREALWFPETRMRPQARTNSS